MKEIRSPVRVLQVVGSMNRGGIETWLMHVLRAIDRNKFTMDFVVGTDIPGIYDDEIRQLGSQIFPCLNPGAPWVYAKNFRSILKQNGPYDVVHSHLHSYSGLVLLVAKRLGVPIRIAHSHTDTTQSEFSVLRRIYLAATKCLLNENASSGLAVSSNAAVSLFGKKWQLDPRWKILHCGIDTDPFQTHSETVRMRQALGIPGDAFVVGHVGRFVRSKNHLFLLAIFAEILKARSDAYLLLVGNGPDVEMVKAKAEALGISDKVIFAGERQDVPGLMLDVMDVFVLPSLYEGLGLVLIEAQAAGLPCIFSDTIPEEVDVVNSLIERIRLDKTAKEWADIIKERYGPRPVKREEAVRAIIDSQFNIMNSILKLEDNYSIKTKTERKLR